MATITIIPLELLSRIFHLVVKDANAAWMCGLRPGSPSEDASFTMLLQVARQHLGDFADSLAWLQQYTPSMLSRPRPYSWTSISRVSRSWRNAALGNPLLWTQVAVIGREATMEMLERAAGRPLIITTAETTDIETLRWVLDTYAAQLDTVVMPFIPELFSPSFVMNASRLRTLFFIKQMLASAPDTTIAPAETQSPFPALERLESDGFLWHPVSHLWASTLKILSLKREMRLRRAGEPAVADQHCLSLAELSRALARTPLLEHLDVELQIRDGDVSVPVELPHLKSLRLVASSASCASFLRAARLPATVDIRMACVAATVQPGPTTALAVPQALCSAITDRATRDQPDFVPVLRLSIAFGSASYQLRGWREPGRPLHPRDDPAPNVELDISISTPDVQHTSRILTTLPFRDAQALRIGPLPWAHDASATLRWVRALCTLPQLRHLAIYEPLDALAEEFPPQCACELLEATSADSVALVGVQLYGADASQAQLAGHSFSVGHELGSKRTFYLAAAELTRHPSGPWKYNGTVAEVVDICTRRHQTGRPFHQITLHNVTGITNGVVGALRQVVESVIWDGFEGCRRRYRERWETLEGERLVCSHGEGSTDLARARTYAVYRFVCVCVVVRHRTGSDIYTASRHAARPAWRYRSLDARLSFTSEDVMEQDPQQIIAPCFFARPLATLLPRPLYALALLS